MKLRKSTIKLTDSYLGTVGHYHSKTSHKGSLYLHARKMREASQKEEYKKFTFRMLLEALKEHTRFNMIAQMKSETAIAYAKKSKKLAKEDGKGI